MHMPRTDLAHARLAPDTPREMAMPREGGCREPLSHATDKNRGCARLVNVTSKAWPTPLGRATGKMCSRKSRRNYNSGPHGAAPATRGGPNDGHRRKWQSAAIPECLPALTLCHAPWSRACLGNEQHSLHRQAYWRVAPMQGLITAPVPSPRAMSHRRGTELYPDC